MSYKSGDLKTSRAISQIQGYLHPWECYALQGLANKTIDQFGQNSIFVEIGSYHGKSTVFIAQALVERAAGILYAIDWHQGDRFLSEFARGTCQSTLNSFCSNLEKYGVIQRVIVIPEKSQEAIFKIPPEIHFLWIDGSHDYEDVKNDFYKYSVKLTQGGYILFHDACWTSWEGPFQAISEEILDNEHYNLYAVVANTVVFKKEKNTTPPLLRKLFRLLCLNVCKGNRGFLKKILSFILFRISTYYTFLLKRL